MATLFERIIGGNENASKIPIHAIRAMTGEIVRGRMTPSQIIAAYDLDAQQQVDLNQFMTKIGSHPDKAHIGLVVFDWLALSEIGVIPEIYRVESNFWSMIDSELALTGV
jgi:hypothetical protein